MNVRQHRRLLWLAAGFFALAGVAVLAGGVATPTDVAAESPGAGDDAVQSALRRASSATSPSQPPDDGAAKGIENLQQLCSVNLRKPLYDPPAVATVAPPQAAVPLPVRLVGMAYEPNQPGQSFAILEKADGSRVGCAEGESVEGPAGPVTVVRIERQKVTVQHRGESQVLVLPPVEGPGND